MSIRFFSYKKRVNFYETDAMAVVHHSNYLRYFEESRLAWYNDREVSKKQSDEDSKSILAVIESTVKYKSALRYNDLFEVRMQVRLEGTRFFFQYAIYNIETQVLICTGTTTHVPVSPEMKVVRPSEKMIEIMKGEPWTETWP